LSAELFRHERIGPLSRSDGYRRGRAREHRDLEVFVNISQLTVSQMSLTEMTDSPSSSSIGSASRC
jgi:hypothetical protein